VFHAYNVRQTKQRTLFVKDFESNPVSENLSEGKAFLSWLGADELMGPGISKRIYIRN
jgi:hypothetical protein